MQFRFEQTVCAPRDKVFAFFQNPARLELLHGGWSKVRVLAHEPQVRVGGPIGMIYSISGGELPMPFALVCVPNDVIWWVPFGLIVYRATRVCP